MIYVFDTSALIWIFDQQNDGRRWLEQIPLPSTIYYHPVTIAEIAAQTHEEYNVGRDDAARIAKRRRLLLVSLANPVGRPPWLRQRRFCAFDTSTKAMRHNRANVYEQLHFEKQQRGHFYRHLDGRVHILASMVDHMILAVASFLHAEHSAFGAFVTRDRQLFEAAQRVKVPSLYAANRAPQPSAGQWL